MAASANAPPKRKAMGKFSTGPTQSATDTMPAAMVAATTGGGILSSSCKIKPFQKIQGAELSPRSAPIQRMMQPTAVLLRPSCHRPPHF
jgi:hypothetical protein